MSNRRARLQVSGMLLLGLWLLAACTAVSTGPLPEVQQESGLLYNRQQIKKGAVLLQDGDLVLRTGNDFISFAMRQFSQTDKTYSHCGLVRVQGGKTWIYHAIGGEDNPQATLRRESFASFCNPQYNLGFGIFRYALNQAQRKRLDSLADHYYQARIPFDMQFDLNSDSSFYCAEFVYKVVNQATGRDYLPFSHMGDFKYIAIDNLFVNAHSCSVYRAVFR